MKNVKVINVTTAKTAELVTFYNAHSGRSKPVKKFADRATAEKRVAALMEELDLAPAPKAKKVASKKVASKKVASKKVASKKAPREATLGDRSAAIAKSWTNPKTHAKRIQRSAVKVDGVQYSSVAAAFRELGLEMRGVIQFRMLLKESGSFTDEGRKWKIIPLNY